MKILYPALLLLLLTVSCKNEKEQTPVTVAEISFTKQAELRLIKSSNDSILRTLDVEIAEEEYKTQTGLMYRKSMEENQGMLFIFPDAQVRSFYMKNTEIPLDIIYIDTNKKIVSFQKNTTPFDATPLPSGVPTQYVLEVNAGLSDSWDLQVGDRIDWNKI